MISTSYPLHAVLDVQPISDSRESSVDPPSPPAITDDASETQQGDISISSSTVDDDYDTAVESGSGLSGSTLRGDQVSATQQVVEETNSERINVEKKTSTSDERVNVQSEEGVNFTVGNEERVNEQSEEGSQEEVQSGEEELSSEGDKFGLNWIRDLQLLPMEHDPAIDEDQGEVPQQQPSTESDIYHLLDQLENIKSDLKIQSQKLKSTTANISFVINTVSMEMGRQLEERLQSVKQRWENLSNRLKLRRAQLTFEKAQRVSVKC